MPPTHATVAMFCGTAAKPAETPKQNTDEEIRDFVAALGLSIPESESAHV